MVFGNLSHTFQITSVKVFSNLKFLGWILCKYRVAHLVAELGWELTCILKCSTVYPLLSGLGEIWQKELESWTR